MNSNKRKKRKIFILFVVIVITTVVLIVGTYAWFVGISTVNVGQFNVAISSSDGLELSLSGANGSWKKNGETLTISQESITNPSATGDHTYSGHTNKWPSALKPLSTYGEIDSTYSRLKFYEKSSIVNTAGGYKLVANQVDNYTGEEADGYIVFDLFIKNGTGTYDSNHIEDIFLSGNSEVTVSSGTNGAANSIRVGFFEIGRIQAKNAAQSNITSINCSDNGDCANGPQYTHGVEVRQGIGTLNIWEPNASKHASNLVNYFNQVCKKRDSDGNYTSEACQPLETGASRNTYSLNSAITTSNNVDIYDGGDINSYTGTVSNASVVGKVYPFDTYKTSDATSVGLDKRPLLKLAPNSITKVRVYIWIEGQDIDNYDLISKDESLNIKFGFTKDRVGIDTTNNTQIDTRAHSTFEDDSWEKIKTNIQNNNISQYHVGDTRKVRIGNKSYTVRLANKSKDSMCNTDAYSKTACGFVVEFVDVVTTMSMRDTATNVGGYPATNVYTYLNNTLYNQLPSDLQSVIVNTKVVSGYGNNGTDSSNFITTNKLYLLSSKEVYGTDAGGNDFWDTADQLTNQLDYYSTNGVTYTTNGYTGTNLNKAIKQYNGSNSTWWLRSAYFNYNYIFASVSYVGYWHGNFANKTYGVSPAFRIG